MKMDQLIMKVNRCGTLCKTTSVNRRYHQTICLTTAAAYCLQQGYIKQLVRLLSVTSHLIGVVTEVR
jgi:hypothetical protein